MQYSFAYRNCISITTIRTGLWRLNECYSHVKYEQIHVFVKGDSCEGGIHGAYANWLLRRLIFIAVLDYTIEQVGTLKVQI